MTRRIVRIANLINQVHVNPIGAISHDLKGEQFCSHRRMIQEGIAAISDDGNCVMNSKFMRQALRDAFLLSLPLI